MASPKYRDKFQEAVAKAYRKALSVIQKESPPDSNANAHILAAAQITPLFIEIDLDEDEKSSETDGA
jgi:hypothetical protein